MPRLSAWLVRFSLIYLLIGFSLGGLMLANEALAFDSCLTQLLPAHVEILMIGWVMQLALGVAYWILPRHAQGPPRGNKFIAGAALALVNMGILLIVINVILHMAWFTLAGRICEVAGILLSIAVLWRRVRSSF